MLIRFDCTLHVKAEGLERAIRDAGHEIAQAILASGTVQTVQITSGQLRLDPQKENDMATSIINSLPQHITAIWTGVDASGNPVSVLPDSVDFSASPAGLGTLTPDADNPTGGATFVANAGSLGDVTFSAVSHQAGLADFTATPVTGTLVPAPVTAIQISGGALSLDPQPLARLRRKK